MCVPNILARASSTVVAVDVVPDEDALPKLGPADSTERSRAVDCLSTLFIIGVLQLYTSYETENVCA